MRRGIEPTRIGVKNRIGSAITRFDDTMDHTLMPGIGVCYVPSSSPTKLRTGIRQVAELAANRQTRVDATACLVRHTKKWKAAHGGPRSIDSHLNTLRVDRTALEGISAMVVIDDITTTGNSLRACRQLLLDARVHCVRMLALGQTVP